MGGMKDHFLGDTPFPPPTFQGETFLHERDYTRLSDQSKKVFDEMQDGQWHTLAELSAETGAPEASVSARIRDIRAALRPNGFDVARRYIENGLWRYRIQRTEAP